MPTNSDHQISPATATAMNAVLLLVVTLTAFVDIRGAHLGATIWLVATVVCLAVTMERHRHAYIADVDFVSLGVFALTFPGRVLFDLLQGSSPHLADMAFTAALLVLVGWTWWPFRESDRIDLRDVRSRRLTTWAGEGDRPVSHHKR